MLSMTFPGMDGGWLNNLTNGHVAILVKVWAIPLPTSLIAGGRGARELTYTAPWRYLLLMTQTSSAVPVMYAGLRRLAYPPSQEWRG